MPWREGLTHSFLNYVRLKAGVENHQCYSAGTGTCGAVPWREGLKCFFLFNYVRSTVGVKKSVRDDRFTCRRVMRACQRPHGEIETALLRWTDIFGN